MNNHYDHNENHTEIVDGQQALLAQLCISVLPLWADQIDSAKQLTNTSIEDLSAKFSGLSSSIHSVTNSGQAQNNQDLIELLNQSQQQLATVISLLKNSIDEKKSMLEAISALSSNTKELLNMADSVTRIAKETGMVAVNAAIEAARVGERGRGFSVVADAVKRLSADAGRTGSLIAETVSRASEAIKNVSQASKELELRDAQTLDKAEEIVSTVIDKFGHTANEVVSTSQQMLNESQHVAQEIDQVLYSLQFQDRVSQMLTLVQQDITKLNLKVNDPDGVGSVDEWLHELKSTYTMRELNQIHDRRSVSAGSSNKQTIKSSKNKVADSSDDITFF